MIVFSSFVMGKGLAHWYPGKSRLLPLQNASNTADATLKYLTLWYLNILATIPLTKSEGKKAETQGLWCLYCKLRLQTSTKYYISGVYWLPQSSNNEHYLKNNEFSYAEFPRTLCSHARYSILPTSSNETDTPTGLWGECLRLHLSTQGRGQLILYD